MKTKQYRRVPKNHPDYLKYAILRFWSKVQKSGIRKCWEWKAGLDSDGYGRFLYHRGTKAHRFSLEIKIGRFLEKDECSCHTCDNPKCVNPYHLFLGDQLINTQDRDNKDRQAKQKGENNGCSLLIEKHVKEIKNRLVAEAWKRGIQTELAQEYKVCKQTITLIKQGKRWGHIK